MCQKKCAEIEKKFEKRGWKKVSFIANMPFKILFSNKYFLKNIWPAGALRIGKEVISKRGRGGDGLRNAQGDGEMHNGEGEIWHFESSISLFLDEI